MLMISWYGCVIVMLLVSSGFKILEEKSKWIYVMVKMFILIVLNVVFFYGYVHDVLCVLMELIYVLELW